MTHEEFKRILKEFPDWIIANESYRLHDVRFKAKTLDIIYKRAEKENLTEPQKRSSLENLYPPSGLRDKLFLRFLVQGSKAEDSEWYPKEIVNESRYIFSNLKKEESKLILTYNLV
ncbi:MAG: hypothetical protein QMD14_02820 [Candidatus Aenigmarchaeota archaeon]|nr:hypothetical protein [Candidatus Aenigmarchaeota archaeon]